MPQKKEIKHSDLANALRMLCVDAIEKAKSGHPGMPLGMADIATILFQKHLKYFPEDPDWPDRDRFVLSAGHGSMLLYALLYLTGYKTVSLDELKRFRQLGSLTPGHPEYAHTEGVETTTGPLGQGLATAIGMAISEKKLAQHFGNQLVNHYTYVIASDGDLMEGISQEAITLAGHLKLGKLIILWDNNGISIDGKISLCDSTNQRQRFESAGWHVYAINGHTPSAIDCVLNHAKNSDKPVFIECQTHIGYGAPTKQDKASSHGSPLGETELKGLRENLGWESAPFTLPKEIQTAWLKAGNRSELLYKNWKKTYLNAPEKEKFDSFLKTEISKQALEKLQQYKQNLFRDRKSEATRKSSGAVLEHIAPEIKNILGGSADLSGSNNTMSTHYQSLTPDNFSGQYLHYGIREHAMAAIMNGMALHKGILPYGGTFLVFSDYCRPSIRLSALMKLRVIYVFTHDSIGLGEDGPTHQPVEHLAALRAILNLYVCRPADSIETAECWEIALKRITGPTALILTRQSLPFLRKQHTDQNLSSQGAYILNASPPEIEEKIAIIATGSEVSIAKRAHQILSEKKIGARLISMPCWEAFMEIDPKQQSEIIGPKHLPKIAIEAASGFGWERWTNNHTHFIGMKSFGASAPAEQLYEHFKITAEHLVEKCLKIIH